MSELCKMELNVVAEGRGQKGRKGSEFLRIFSRKGLKLEA